MKVKELIDILKKLDPERKVMLAIDPEGNNFHFANCVEEMNYFDGEIHYTELTEELKEDGFTEEDIKKEGDPVAVIWP